MKNPNGYGSITKLSGKRRKPYIVRVTTAWELTEDGKSKQIQTVIGSYATKEEANIALANYHQDPYSLPTNTTVQEVYERWSSEKFPTVSQKSIEMYSTVWKYCEPIHNKPFAELRRSHLQGLIDNCGKNYPVLKNIKTLLGQLYKYAMQNDIVDRDYSKTININIYKTETEEIHHPFEHEEIAVLWEASKYDEWCGLILMLIYSGCRISELLDLKKEDVHLAEKYFEIKKAKTKAGRRKVPIAKKTMPFFEYWMTKNKTQYLINSQEKTHISYDTYRYNYFDLVLHNAGIKEHLPHDTRHTCVSLLVEAGVIPSIVKRIVGHASQDITESVYTHHDMAVLYEAINKI